MSELRMPEPSKLPILKKFQPEFEEWLTEQRKGKKTVCIVGFANTTRSLAPYDNNDPDIEIWGLNEAYRHHFMENSKGEFVADLWFQIHKPWSYMREQNRNHPNHWLWLQNMAGPCTECRGEGKVPTSPKKTEFEKCEDCEGTGTYIPTNRKDFTIIMQHKDPRVPGSEAYPLDDVIAEFLPNVIRGAEVNEYFTSSYAYMIAYAGLIFKKELDEGRLRIETYGFEMSTETEYHYQKGSTEFWMGLIAGRGAEIWVPESCQLLKGAKYGFEVTQMINRQELEFRQRQLKDLEAKKVAALNAISGQRQKTEQDLNKLQGEINKLLQKKDNDKFTDRDEGRLEVKQEQFQEKLKERNEIMQREINTLSEANAVGGASQEISALIAYIDAQYNFADAEMPVREPQPSVVGMATEVKGEQGSEQTEEDK